MVLGWKWVLILICSPHCGIKTRKTTNRSGRNAASLPRSVPDVKGEGPSGPEIGGRDSAIAPIAIGQTQPHLPACDDAASLAVARPLCGERSNERQGRPLKRRYDICRRRSLRCASFATTPVAPPAASTILPTSLPIDSLPPVWSHCREVDCSKNHMPDRQSLLSRRSDAAVDRTGFRAAAQKQCGRWAVVALLASAARGPARGPPLPVRPADCELPETATLKRLSQDRA